jgi:nucleoside-diphosphate-sugar epimerase
MTDFPKTITTVAQLDELLSRPLPALVAFMKKLEGDIMIIGAAGKVGPTIALMAKRAVDAAGVKKRVIAVDKADLSALKAQGIETINCDLLDLDAVKTLPQVANIYYLVGRKFGSDGQEHLTWAINVMVAHNVAQTFTKSRIAAFSTGCVYPVVDLRSGGSTEEMTPDPIGEYTMSCLGRERMFDFYSRSAGERVVQCRLNYALELRYGVLVDIATKVWQGEPVNVTTGYANGIWQGDACNQILQSIALAASPMVPLNITGPETFSIREVALTFGRMLGKTAIIEGEENGRGYLNNARKANGLFGNPSVPLGLVMEWVAQWIKQGGELLGKSTHFETQNGKY